MTHLPTNIDAADSTVRNPSGRDCIVFMPGIGEAKTLDQSVEGIAYRIASALSTNAKDQTAVFSSKIHPVDNVADHTGNVGTIYREDDSGVVPVIDIFMFDYRGTLIETYENRNLLIKSLLSVLALPGGTVRILRAMMTGRASKSRVEKLQLLFALGILGLLFVYVVILFGSLWATIDSSGILKQLTTPVTTSTAATTIPPAPITHDTKAPLFATIAQSAKAASFAPITHGAKASSFSRDAIAAFFAKIMRTLSQLGLIVVVFWAILQLFLPPKLNFKEMISKAAVDYLCLNSYLNLGVQRRTIVGKLENLIDEISRKSENERKKGTGAEYRRIDLLAYSFGSIVALDALFPGGRKPGRPLQSVRRLVTIGCPFDFVRTLWPSYYDDRREFDLDPEFEWLNVYSPLDLLGSNFRNDSKAVEANVNIRSAKKDLNPDVPAPDNLSFNEGLDLNELSWLSSFTLVGLRAHEMYWSSKREPEVNCFGALVTRMYGDHPILG